MPFFDEAVGILGELGSNATFLSQHAIQPGVNEWSAEREFIANRLKTEIFNLTLGVEKGDEVEAQRDPQILKALEILSQKSEDRSHNSNPSSAVPF
jgi:hypothetical protein